MTRKQIARAILWFYGIVFALAGAGVSSQPWAC